MKKILLCMMMLGILWSCQSGNTSSAEGKNMSQTHETKIEKIAMLAGGCFWCVEADMEKLPGVIRVISGYAGGLGANPTYETYSRMGYIEVVQVYYDPGRLSYEQVLNYFLRHMDPTDAGGQFADRGAAYRSAIFYSANEEKKIAEKVLQDLGKSGKFDKPIVTEIIKSGTFYPAEEYHQDYYKKNPIRYKYYRSGSGRNTFLEKTWGNDSGISPISTARYKKSDDATLKKKLTKIQYDVTQKNGTEPPFQNEYDKNRREGIYVDIVSGEPLFSSQDKFDSGTGWPSFTRPLEPANIIEKEDRGIFGARTEVRSRYGNSHLGHVFPDGPKPTGLRYCMNSAALRFIPKEDLEKEGYGQYVILFSTVK